MPFCLKCGRCSATNQQFCRNCEQKLEPKAIEPSGEIPSEDPSGGFTEVPRVAIARFQSGAEAGYFADELTRRTGIETDVVIHERFDAVHAVWTVDYLLLVARDQADEAPRLVQELVDSTGSDDMDEAPVPTITSDVPAGVWVPLIITLAAGSIACFGIERVDHRPRPAALVVGDGRRPPELWEILGSTEGPWVQQLDGRGAVRRLTLDREQRTARLEEDHDGDGHVDREWEFSWGKL